MLTSTEHQQYNKLVLQMYLVKNTPALSEDFNSKIEFE